MRHLLRKKNYFFLSLEISTLVRSDWREFRKSFDSVWTTTVSEIGVTSNTSVLQPGLVPMIEIQTKALQTSVLKRFKNKSWQKKQTWVIEWSPNWTEADYFSILASLTSPWTAWTRVWKSARLSTITMTRSRRPLRRSRPSTGLIFF